MPLSPSFVDIWAQVFECSGLAQGWHLTPHLGCDWLILYTTQRPPSLLFHPFFSKFPSAPVVCDRKKANHVPGWGMRSFLSRLSRLAVCWSGLLEESRKVPFPQRAIWLHQTHADANLLVSFSLFFFNCCGCSQGPLQCSCKLRLGPAEGKGSFGARIYYGIMPPCTPIPL